MKKTGESGGKALSGALLPSLKALARFVGPLALASIGVAVVGRVGWFMKSAVTEAGNLEQSVGAIDAVFKGSAGQMHDWAKSAATDVGLTQNEFNELGTLIGAQLKNGGTAMDQLAPKTNQLIGLGADLSSMFGGTTRDAVDALSAALKGERDPIERYGVSLNQAAVDAKAAELGFAKVGGALSMEANQAATIALIMDQTADAHGNFASEADTLAHKQQVLNAVWADGKAQIGNALLPAVSAVTGALAQGMGPALAGVATGISGLMAAAQLLFTGDFSGGLFGVTEDSGLVDFLLTARETVLSVVDGITAAVAPFVPQIVSSFSALGPQALALLTSFSPLSLILRALMPVLPELAGYVAQLAAAVLPLFTNGMAAFASNLALFTQLFASNLALFTTISSALMPVALDLFTQLAPVLLSVLAAVLPLVSAIVSGVLPITTSLVSVLQPVAGLLAVVVAALLPVVLAIVGILAPAFQALQPTIETVFAAVSAVIDAALGIVLGVIDVVTGILTGNWDQVWSGIGQIVGGVWNTIVAIVQGTVAIMASAISGALAAISAVWTGVWSAVGSTIAGAWNGIVGAVSSGAGRAVSFVQGLPQMLLSGLGNVGAWLIDAGRNLMGGFVGGLGDFAASLLASLAGPLGDLIGGAKSLLGIHSPSTVFYEHGLEAGEHLLPSPEASAATDVDIPEGGIIDRWLKTDDSSPIRAKVVYHGGVQPGDPGTALADRILHKTIRQIDGGRGLPVVVEYVDSDGVPITRD
jgi:hypothetical protein